MQLLHFIVLFVYAFSCYMQYLGCMSSYVPECVDNSDVFVCPATACKNDAEFFPCDDGKYCIFESLVCDGYAQCEDESGKSEMKSVLFFKCSSFLCR